MFAIIKFPCRTEGTRMSPRGKNTVRLDEPRLSHIHELQTGAPRRMEPHFMESAIRKAQMNPSGELKSQKRMSSFIS